jgi:hypothetical protein
VVIGLAHAMLDHCAQRALIERDGGSATFHPEFGLNLDEGLISRLAVCALAVEGPRRWWSRITTGHSERGSSLVLVAIVPSGCTTRRERKRPNT